jgi:hypothetical protein
MDECSVKRTPIRRVSKKRAATFPARRECVRIVLERDGGCVFNRRVMEHLPLEIGWGKISMRCDGRLDVHEPRHRSQGADPTDPAQCETLCRAHHDLVHTQPLVAKLLGL